MSEYKCINCGKVLETKGPRTCPDCGYRMFEVPYDKDETIRKEIVDFVGQLKPTDIRRSDISYHRKNEKGAEVDKKTDDKRFPNFDTIQKYVCAAEKTEAFCERLNESIQEIRKYLCTSYKQIYKVSFSNLGQRITSFDGPLIDAMRALDIDLELPGVTFPKATVEYTEDPDKSAMESLNIVLDLLQELSDKIEKFVKINNVYGTEHSIKYACSFKLQKDQTNKECLDKLADDIDVILKKKYILDIFSDGSEELEEMLKTVWKAINILMTLPILNKKYVYTLEDGTTAVGDEINSKILEVVFDRYKELGDIIYADGFLADKSGDELFGLYNKMIELDKNGIMGMSASGLIHTGESEKKLNELIGLSSIKDNIQKIKAFALANKDAKDLNMHMCFYGNPGSGKTEVARIIAGILYENKILPTKNVVEVDRGGLVSQYLGDTAQKTEQKIMEAMGGVLFVDEAYALVPEDGAGYDYGHEAVATLIKAMEDYRGQFCVILAGYKNEMQKMLASNPGFKSRIQFELDFPNYSRDELGQIAKLMLEKRGYTITDDGMDRILDITDVTRKNTNFANAREIRNILDQVIMCQNLRSLGSDDKEIGMVDVNKYINDTGLSLPQKEEHAHSEILTGDEELDRLIGLKQVKRMIRKIRAYVKKNKDNANLNMHMCFYGNPGTGKTEVARIISRILYDAGVLGEAKLVETDAHGLIGKVVGETAPKTLAKIDEATDGVLFIDEAYSLTGGKKNDTASASYGEEAIAVLLKEMEDRRGKFCVILAGYKDEMKSMISVNPGLQSRIQFTLEFPDYTREELGQIAEMFLSKKEYEIEPDALEKILDITEYYRARPNFANARTVRNIIDQVIMDQNLRTEDMIYDKTIILEDVEDYIEDEDIDLSKTHKPEGRTIGF